MSKMQSGKNGLNSRKLDKSEFQENKTQEELLQQQQKVSKVIQGAILNKQQQK
ncbi:unnamed protein product (macronuclear) [Paramecium tetraurelia]|uniref:Small EDRK-rich factor-like N-terminal domain-containing protein n=1 Tax=Paramecium tetraurelia TaxID=5888 RepID=A0DYD1_PARTE|nr:uncharacterized protein GSPATT00003016001 [Paramecium tetraurelia]CAK88048.1 unnamed protein product [Paramecium tetraurelia]|eukprot:XP_001455445.1 hypothetical protein (macronuclear) [Paramecium tetraurelia strain d4-2]